MKRFFSLVFLLACLGLCAGCAALTGSAPEVIPEYVLTYADNQPEGYPTTEAALEFARLVEERTGGKVMVQVQADGEFGSEQEILTQMQFGGVDFARVSLSSLADELPVLNLLQLPFLYEDAEHMWRVLDGAVGQELLEQVQQLGLVGLSWYDAGARSFYCRTRPIRSAADLQGLAIRVQDSALMAEMIRLLGGRAVILSYSDVYYAFETGRIDAAENNWPAYQALRHYEVAPYFTVDQHTRVPEIQLASGRTWEKLPEEYQQILLECAAESAKYQRQLWTEQEGRARAAALDSGCVEIDLTEELLEEFRALVQPIYDEYETLYPALLEKIRNS